MKDRMSVMAEIMDSLEEMSIDGLNRVLGFACGVNAIEHAAPEAA